MTKTLGMSVYKVVEVYWIFVGLYEIFMGSVFLFGHPVL